MKNHSYISMQQDMPDQGQLQVTVLDSASNRPVENATVRISYTGVPDNVIEEIRTDSSGKTPMLELAAPPLEYSMKPVEQQPYAEYTVRISAEGFTPKEVAGTEVLPHSIARQGASLSRQQGSGEDYQRIVIGPHGLKVYLCHDHHIYGPEAVHNNARIRHELQRTAQRLFEKQHSHKEFMEIFGRNYLETWNMTGIPET